MKNQVCKIAALSLLETWLAGDARADFTADVAVAARAVFPPKSMKSAKLSHLRHNLWRLCHGSREIAPHFADIASLVSSDSGSIALQENCRDGEENAAQIRTGIEPSSGCQPHGTGQQDALSGA